MRMRNRRRGALVARVIMVVALTAAACGSEAPVSDVASAPPVTATASDATGRAEALTDRLIGQLGSDTAATDAVLVAMEVGYDHAQLLAAIDANALQPDGRIAGVDPAGPELGVVELAAGAAAAATAGEGDLVLVSFQSGGERTPVAELRAGVANLAEVLGSGDDSAVQRPPTHYVLLLLVQGFPFEIVMQAIVLGPDAPLTTGCRRSEDGVPVLRIGGVNHCADGTVSTLGDEPAEPTSAGDDDTNSSTQAEPAVEEPATGETIVYRFVMDAATELDPETTLAANEFEIEASSDAVVRADGRIATNSVITFEADDFNDAGSCEANVAVTYQLSSPISIDVDGRFSGTIDNEFIGTGDCFVDGRWVIFAGPVSISGQLAPNGASQVVVDFPESDNENVAFVQVDLIPEG